MRRFIFVPSFAALLIAFFSTAYAKPLTAAPAFEFFPRRRIDTRLLGVNAFANDQRFGSVRSQLREVHSTLKLKYIRVLLDWNDGIQPSPTAPIFWSFYDEILRNIPRGVVAMPVVTGLPSWMSNSANWIDGDPRRTFVEYWAKRVIRRYGKSSRVNGFQIWNEPNMTSNPQNSVLEVANNPENYVSLLRSVKPSMRRYAPRKKLVSAATTAINQDFPDTLDYNRALKAAGLQNVADVWGVHYYGSSHERLYLGIADFLNGLNKPIWISEIGEQGTTKQRAYMERAIPLIKRLVPGARRFYIYQFTEASPAYETYGLKNLTLGSATSDLYQWLKSQPRR